MSQTNHQFVSMDGNFGLVRKKHAGASFEPPKNANALFIREESVEDFLKQCDDSNGKQYSEVSRPFHYTFHMNIVCVIFLQ